MLANKQDIENFLVNNLIRFFTINEDLSVDVDGDVRISYRNLTEIPVKFNIVKGDFYCCNNQIRSTNFFPKEIGNNFFYYSNEFNDLKGIVTLENIIGLWNCNFRGNKICCDRIWFDEVRFYLLSINRLKEVKIYVC